MVGQTYKPAFAKAVASIKSLITGGELAVGDRLPTVRALAQACGVNNRTVMAAINQLKKEGILDGKRPIVVALPGEQKQSPQPLPLSVDKAKLNVAQKVRSLAIEDVTTGFYAPGQALPSIKELCARYAASSMTIRGVLEQLYAEKLLSMKMRKYYVRRYDFSASLSRIVLIGLAYAIEPDASIIMGSHDDSFIAHMSTLCSQMNIRFELARAPVSSCETVFSLATTRPFVHSDDIVGYIFLSNTQAAHKPQLFEKIASTGVPLAVIDETGDTDIDTCIAKNPRARVFSHTVGEGAAKSVVRALAQLGHRRFGFYSSYESAAWSTVRENAVSRQLMELGLADNLESITFDAHKELIALMPEKGRTMLQSAGTLQKAMCATLAGYPQPVTKLFKRPYFIVSIRNQMLARNMELFCRRKVVPAIRNSKTTAWIAANDSSAFILIDAFRRLKVRIPRDVSIASMDNSQTALIQGLSSYDFNIPGVAHGAVNFLLAPDKPFSKRLPVRVEIAGRFIQRNSTGKAR
jgi:DNA-binding LacI/PurR family transcriptional regulator/DNA-binding transcriptional regulator YhcF (GntR family)